MTLDEPLRDQHRQQTGDKKTEHDGHEAEQLAAAGIEFAAHQLKFKPEAEILEKIADADVVLVNMVTMDESILSKMPNCKLLIRHGIGYDNVDVAACTKYGIQFAYQPDYCKEDVAEHAIALIFACARKVVRSRKILDDASARGMFRFSILYLFTLFAALITDHGAAGAWFARLAGLE